MPFIVIMSLYNYKMSYRFNIIFIIFFTMDINNIYSYEKGVYMEKTDYKLIKMLIGALEMCNSYAYECNQSTVYQFVWTATAHEDAHVYMVSQNAHRCTVVIHVCCNTPPRICSHSRRRFHQIVVVSYTITHHSFNLDTGELPRELLYSNPDLCSLLYIKCGIQWPRPTSAIMSMILTYTGRLTGSECYTVT